MKQLVIAIIPARAGSKGVPGKNIRLLDGYPLIAYSIAAAKLSRGIDRVIVSTDSQEIADIAVKFGAEVPFLRPKELAGDSSPDRDFVMHALNWFRENEKIAPDYLVHLRPTTPLRDPSHIEKAIDLILSNPEATSLRSGFPLRESPHKMLKIQNGYFTGLFPDDVRPEYYNLPRQNFADAYQPDGYVDILVPKHILASAGLHGSHMVAYESPNTGEIDTPEDFKFVEYNLQNKPWSIHTFLKEKYKPQ